jgi:hypothetical protein
LQQDGDHRKGDAAAARMRFRHEPELSGPRWWLHTSEGLTQDTESSMSQAENNNTSIPSRRAILAGIAAAPALAAPAIAMNGDPSGEEIIRNYRELPPRAKSVMRALVLSDDASLDAELLALGVRLKPIEEEFAAQIAIDRASTTFTVHERDDGGWETDVEPWDAIHGRLFPLAEEILSKKARTIAGLAVQARAVTLAAREIWEPEFMEEHDHERKFIESVCAFVGVAIPTFGDAS